MPIKLALSYAFSIWMVVDAFQRGAAGWWIVIILLPFGEFVYFFVVKIHDYDIGSFFSGRGRQLKCADCEHCVVLYRNGVRCQVGETPVFKTPTHVDYCTAYSRVSSAR